MAKKTVKFTDLVSQYVEVKLIYDEAKKKEAELNKQIKAIMSEKGLNEVQWNDTTIQYSERTSDVYDEEAMLEYMHKHKEFAPCIKVKEYFDVDVLEDLMYKGEIPKKLQIGLDKFRTTKVTEVLKVKKV
jgi:hypothetical protein